MEQSISLEKCKYCEGTGSYGEWGVYPCTDCERTGFKYGKKALAEHRRIEEEEFEKADRSIEAYIEEQIKEGYINEELAPLKCQFCDSADLEEVEHIGEEGRIDEFKVKCCSCSKIVGSWSYGQWNM